MASKHKNTDDIYERARLSRDARFDGQFFVGVRTTGIYCRPICPAVPPKRENVTFYPTAAAASEAGYRPCLRCRPECAPGTPAWAGTSTTVRRGLRLIAEGALDEGNVETLAERLGVTSRHLRRLFTRHLGASPQSVAHTQRLHFAKQLIDQTGLPMHQISVAAGYGSVRRFNDAFRKTYGRTPRELRKSREAEASGSVLTVQMPARMPFDGASLLRFFSARAIPGVECVTDDRYLRSIICGDTQGIMDVRLGDGLLSLTLHGVGTADLFPIVQCTRRLFDIDAPIAEIGRCLGRDPALRRRLDRFPGIRVPGAWDGFELTVRAILGQQISVKAATTLAGRIAERYGEPIGIAIPGVKQSPDRVFPEPARLRRARLETLGITTSRARTIRQVARAVELGELRFDASGDADEVRELLTSIPGIGEWTAAYVSMRALKDPDAFPASDLGLLRAFDETAGRRLKPAELSARADAWRPWRAYAALLLWGSGDGAGG